MTMNDDDDAGSDRISRLPESVLHHILCFLSHKKAVQTSVLSKSWLHLGPTRPVIGLRGACGYHDVGHVRGVCENCFNGNDEAFISVLEKTFERYHEHNLFPHKLDLHMLGDDSKSISVLDKWIPIFLNKHAVTTFRLSFKIGPCSNLPSVVFKAEYLRELYLNWCSLSDIISIDNLMLKNLQSLSLKSIEISDEALEKIVAGCPLVKSVVLYNCRGLKTINIGIKNQYLNYFEVSCSYANPNDTSIAINNPTLESIRIEGGKSNWYPNNRNYFPHLKSLYLSNVTLSTDSFDNFSCNFPHLKYLLLSVVRLSTELFHNFSCNLPSLQELSLFYCSGCEEINLSSHSIKRLIIHESVKKVDIDVPNILYFEFSSYYLPTTFSLTKTSGREWKSHLDLSNHVHDYGDDDVLQRIHKLFEMVKELSQSQISLTIFEVRYFKIKQWDFTDHPVILEHLGLAIINLCPDSRIHFLNDLFRMFRPRYTNAVCPHREGYEEITEFLWKTLTRERETMEYRWEQYLEEVSIEASDEKGIVWHHVVRWTSLPRWSDSQKIRFRMKWRD